MCMFLHMFAELYLNLSCIHNYTKVAALKAVFTLEFLQTNTNYMHLYFY